MSLNKKEMSKKVIATLFSVAFLLFVAMPTILVIVDDTIDISIVFSDSEEEEKGSEKELDIKFPLAVVKINEEHSIFRAIENNLGCFHKKYAKPHLNIILPPPDLYLL